MKRLMTSFIVVLAVTLVCGVAYALTGACSNCHTMHNSQNGQGQVTSYDGNGTLLKNRGTPQPQLLKASCIACHTGAASDTGKINASNSAPIVLHLTCPTGQGGTATLAGGDFCFVAKGVGTPSDSKGHNVEGVSDQDQHINKGAAGYTPPGWDPSATPGALGDGTINNGVDTWSAQLTCDGVRGCHGQHNATGITGAHHNNTGLSATRASNPTNVGNSYRFLSGIKGLENIDWNYNEAIGTHNEYYGENLTFNRGQSNSNYGSKDTISYSCAECHGYFHSRIDNTATGSPWLRHPTDVDLPNSLEYQYYNPEQAGGSPRTYSLEAPVARPSTPATSSQNVTPGTDIVMCLSCHRAHGSPEADILRWVYNMRAGTGNNDTGCFTCHVNKNVDQNQ